MIRLDATVREMLHLPIGDRRPTRSETILSLLPVIKHRSDKWCRSNGDGGFIQGGGQAQRACDQHGAANTW